MQLHLIFCVVLLAIFIAPSKGSKEGPSKDKPQQKPGQPIPVHTGGARFPRHETRISHHWENSRDLSSNTSKNMLHQAMRLDLTDQQRVNLFEGARKNEEQETVSQQNFVGTYNTHNQGL